MKYTMKEAAGDILASETFRKSDGYRQHGNTSVMAHSIHVTCFSMRIASFFEKYGIRFDERSLIRGALLHDYFCYDYHNGAAPGNVHPKLHGFYHPSTAEKNAERDFKIKVTEKNIILRHMWPLTVIPPASREGWIVTFADKYCTIREEISFCR